MTAPEEIGPGQVGLRKEQGRRLRQARQRAGYKEAAEAARAIGVPVPTYHAHENGDRSIAKNASLYSRAFKVDIHWLLDGEAGLGELPSERLAAALVREANVNWRRFKMAGLKGPSELHYAVPVHGTATETVPVIALAGDGLWINLAEWKPPRFQPLPRNPEWTAYRQVGFQVAGHSAGAFAGDGTFLLCVSCADIPKRGLRHDDVVVVENRREELVEYVVRRVRSPPDEDCCYLERMNNGGTPDRVGPDGSPGGQLFLVVALYRPTA